MTDLRALLRDAYTVERIAAAIYRSRNGKGCVPWSRRSQDHRAPYRQDAQAAIDEILDAMEGGNVQS